MPYAPQKLMQAVDRLIGAGTVQRRLSHAATELAQLKAFAPHEITPEIDEVIRKLTAGQGGAEAATARLSDDDGVKLAHEILSIYTALLGGLPTS
jgi:hypothetical protein